MTPDQFATLGNEVESIKRNADALLAHAKQRDPAMCVAATINMEEAFQRSVDVLRKSFPAVTRILG